MNRRIHSVTTLDEFRKYQLGEKFDGSEYTTDEFISFMENPFQPTPKMEAGTAVHSLIENAGYGDLPDFSSVNGWTIIVDTHADIAVPPSREVAISKCHKGFELRGRVDSISATSVRDIKTTSILDMDRYMTGYQWRAYLWIAQASRFYFDVLRVNVEEEEMKVYIKEYVEVELRRYPGLDRDVEALLDQYLDCIQDLGFWKKEAA